MISRPMNLDDAVSRIRVALRSTGVVPTGLRDALQSLADQVPPLVIESRSDKAKLRKAYKDRAEIHARLRTITRTGGGF